MIAKSITVAPLRAGTVTVPSPTGVRGFLYYTELPVCFYGSSNLMFSGHGKIFLQRQSDQGEKMDSHLHLLARLRINKAVILLSSIRFLFTPFSKLLPIFGTKTVLVFSFCDRAIILYILKNQLLALKYTLKHSLINL